MCTEETQSSGLFFKIFLLFTFLIARASDLQAKMKVWFPSAVVKVGTGKTDRKESAILDILTITIFKVDPVPIEGGIFHNKKVPPQALEYPLNNATNVFVMKKMFERNGVYFDRPQPKNTFDLSNPPKRIDVAEGGIMDLGGKEMDLRGGGFVPIGKKEKADDVPARLSKNEFVMTADAVRAAGGGSVNKGAKRMYNLMNSLEARV